MKNILIALDFDPSAQKVAETGYALGKAMKANIVLLHVVADPVYYSTLQYSPIMGFGGMNNPEVMPIQDTEALDKAAHLFLEQSKKHLGDETINTVTEEGDTAEVILKLVDEMKIDLVVMGSHSRSGLDKILMGSVTEEVLHKSKIPLFIIPTRD